MSCMKRSTVKKSRAARCQLRRHRRTWGLSGKELASILGIRSPAHLSRIEHGKRTPRIEVALACQALFGISPAQMFPQIYALVEDRIIRNIAERHLALADSITLTGKRKREFYEATLARAVKRPDGPDAV